VLAKVFAALRADGIIKHDISAQVGVHPSEIDQLAFGLMLVGLAGGDVGSWDFPFWKVTKWHFAPEGNSWINDRCHPSVSCASAHEPFR